MKDNSKMGLSDSLIAAAKAIMEKEHTVPKSAKEKALAKLAHPKDKITHKDVLVGRGVLKKENSGERMGVIVGTRKEKVELEPKLKESEQVDEPVNEATHIFHVHLKGAEPRSRRVTDPHSFAGDRRVDDEPAGKEERGSKIILRVKAATRTKALGAAAKHAAKTYGVGNVRSIVHKGIAEEVEQVDERELTAAEKAKKEKYVLSLKGKMGGFKKRYGDRAKEVMYATATKMAKEDIGEVKKPGGSLLGDPRVQNALRVSKVLQGKGSLASDPKKEKENNKVNEVSTGLVSRYLSKTQDDDKRQAGRALALKKKWGGRVRGTEAPKVPTKD